MYGASPIPESLLARTRATFPAPASEQARLRLALLWTVRGHRPQGPHPCSRRYVVASSCCISSRAATRFSANSCICCPTARGVLKYWQSWPARHVRLDLGLLGVGAQQKEVGVARSDRGGPGNVSPRNRRANYPRRPARCSRATPRAACGPDCPVPGTALPPTSFAANSFESSSGEHHRRKRESRLRATETGRTRCSEYRRCERESPDRRVIGPGEHRVYRVEVFLLRRSDVRAISEFATAVPGLGEHAHGEAVGVEVPWVSPAGGDHVQTQSGQRVGQLIQPRQAETCCDETAEHLAGVEPRGARSAHSHRILSSSSGRMKPGNTQHPLSSKSLRAATTAHQV